MIFSTIQCFTSILTKNGFHFFLTLKRLCHLWIKTFNFNWRITFYQPTRIIKLHDRFTLSSSILQMIVLNNQFPKWVQLTINSTSLFFWLRSHYVTWENPCHLIATFFIICLKLTQNYFSLIINFEKNILIDLD